MSDPATIIGIIALGISTIGVTLESCYARKQEKNLERLINEQIKTNQEIEDEQKTSRSSR
jgi:hypothetical protein